MVHVINYVRARGHVFFSERSERRLGATHRRKSWLEDERTDYPLLAMLFAVCREECADPGVGVALKLGGGRWLVVAEQHRLVQRN
jgi:hypothetical protein